MVGPPLVPSLLTPIPPTQHPFVVGISDKRPLRELVAEARADVLEEEDEEEGPVALVREERLAGV